MLPGSVLAARKGSRQPWRTARGSARISRARLGGLQGALQPKVSQAVFEAGDGYHKGPCTLHVGRDGAPAQKCFPTLLLGTVQAS